MKPRVNPGLYWRLLASYLLVVIVGCTTLFWAGQAFTTYFFERHMGGIAPQMRMNSMMDWSDSDDSARTGLARFTGGMAVLLITESA